MQLGYTVIRSPINGRTGNLTVKVGNLVTANATELMTIAQVEPIYVTFSVPAAHLPAIKRTCRQNKLPVTATRAGRRRAQPASGELDFIDNIVDPSTDTIKLKAQFANRRAPAVARPVRPRQPALTTLSRRWCVPARRCRPARTVSSSSSSSTMDRRAAHR